MLLLKITTGQRASRLLAHEGFSHSEERRERRGVWQVAASGGRTAEPETRDQRPEAAARFRFITIRTTIRTDTYMYI